MRLQRPADSIAVQLRRRREAAWRCEPLECGCRDPWPCRHYDGPPSEQMLDAYQDAAEHLLALDLPPAPNVVAMRRMWRRGGDGLRLAARIAEHWGLAG